MCEVGFHLNIQENVTQSGFIDFFSWYLAPSDSHHGAYLIRQSLML